MSPKPYRFCFEEFVASPETGELHKRGRRVSLQEKPFQILALLLRNPGELVFRKEIQATLWPGVFVEKDVCLNTAMRKLRAALGDRAAAPRFIETVGSRGYRLLPPVRVAAMAASDERSTHDCALAVIPFQNLNSTGGEPFARGLTEQMIAQLGRTCQSVRLIAPFSAAQYKPSAESDVKLCRELKADHILSGSVLYDHGRLRVTARLLRARDQHCLWTDSYARGKADVFLVQDEITRQIARAVLQTLGGTTSRTGAKS